MIKCKEIFNWSFFHFLKRFSEKPNFVIEAYRYATRIGGFNLTFIELMQILWDVEFRDIVLKVLNKQAGYLTV